MKNRTMVWISHDSLEFSDKLLIYLEANATTLFGDADDISSEDEDKAKKASDKEESRRQSDDEENREQRSEDENEERATAEDVS